MSAVYDAPGPVLSRGIQSGRFPLGPFCNQAAQAASVNFSGKGPKREQGG